MTHQHKRLDQHLMSNSNSNIDNTSNGSFYATYAFSKLMTCS